MSDPFNFNVPPLPMKDPAEIRRAGDRRRRRRAAATVGGAMAAVVLIATPIAVFQNQDEPTRGPGFANTSPTPKTPTSTPPVAEPVVEEIPQEFSLEIGLPLNPDYSSPVVTDKPAVEFYQCGSYLELDDNLLAAQGVEWSSEAESSIKRSLLVFPSEKAALAELAKLHSNALTESCDDGSGAGSYNEIAAWTPKTVPARLTWVQGYTSDGQPMTGLDTYEAAQKGNLLLLQHSSGEALLNEESKAAALAESAESFDQVLPSFGDIGAQSIEPVIPPLTDANLLPVDGLPKLPADLDASPWAVAPDQSAWACRPQGFDEWKPKSSLARSYEAMSESDTPLAMARTEILQYEGSDEAIDAFETAKEELANCRQRDNFTYLDGREEGRTAVLGVTYLAPEVCTDCDAAWFDYMAVAQIDDRVVLVSYARVGGPLEPEDMLLETELFLDRAAKAAE